MWPSVKKNQPFPFFSSSQGRAHRFVLADFFVCSLFSFAPGAQSIVRYLMVTPFYVAACAAKSPSRRTLCRSVCSNFTGQPPEDDRQFPRDGGDRLLRKSGIEKHSGVIRLHARISAFPYPCRLYQKTAQSGMPCRTQTACRGLSPLCLTKGASLRYAATSSPRWNRSGRKSSDRNEQATIRPTPGTLCRQASLR